MKRVYKFIFTFCVFFMFQNSLKCLETRPFTNTLNHFLQNHNLLTNGVYDSRIYKNSKGIISFSLIPKSDYQIIGKSSYITSSSNIYLDNGESYEIEKSNYKIDSSDVITNIKGAINLRGDLAYIGIGTYSNPIMLLKPEQIKITLDINSGEVLAANGWTVSSTGGYETAYIKGDSQAFPDVKKEGSSFLGWYYNDEKVENLSDVDFTASSSLEARWSSNSYDIAYNFDGGTAGASKPTVAFYGSEITVSHPTKTGYTFDGWNITGLDTCTHIFDSSLSINTTLTNVHATKFMNLRSTSGEVLFTAFWNINSYSIAYNLDGGSSYYDNPESAEYNETLYIYEPTKNGYTFTGWDITGMDSTVHVYGSNTTSSDSLSKVNESSYKNLRSTSGTVTFTATWRPDSSLSFSYTGSFGIGTTLSSAQSNSYSNSSYTFTDSTWQVYFLTSGTLTINGISTNVDLFAVGGGSGGATGCNDYSGERGGSGGRTTTKKNQSLTSSAYSVTIGSGGSAGSGGGTTSFGSLISAAGGTTSSGGSGGGGGGSSKSKYAIRMGQGGGSNGGNGTSTDSCSAGTGQGTTTRAFGESSGELYAGGGGGGGGGSHYGGDPGAGGGGYGKAGRSTSGGSAGSTNTGGGGGGCGARNGIAFSGGSGVIIMRNAR